MRVNLGRGDMAMAKELLDRADIVAVFKKLRRETVSQRVGGSVLREGLVQHASELAWEARLARIPSVGIGRRLATGHRTERHSLHFRSEGLGGSANYRPIRI